ncbi:hypothetical protein [Thalassotalea agarivorans]|uniref:Uncharacterized protein n=1 Tax=Thalassotalea agarivorans TaxID=349064 RepID=A0A1I0BTZ7_THASX|nr:hypothetical protein [Thalassotalea agarivorans]SET10516.1 hypothetical protein SAMN05660429_01055 [Thalassotalea agarivorans]
MDNQSALKWLSYLLVGISCYLTFSFQHLLWYVLAGICFLLAATIQIALSKDIRNDSPLLRKHVVPQRIYEYMPYLYIAFGVGLIKESILYYWQFCGLVLLVIGIRHIACRHVNRSKLPSKF